MINPLYLPELREMIADDNHESLREFCDALHPARTADFMEGLTPSEAWTVLSHADPSDRAAIFCYFDESFQIELVNSVDRGEMAAPDHRVGS